MAKRLAAINAYNQDALMRFGFDPIDFFIYDWFVQFRGSGSMSEIVNPEDGLVYYWVSFKAFGERYPWLAEGKSDHYISDRFTRLVERGLLTKCLINTRFGMKAAFRLDFEKYGELKTFQIVNTATPEKEDVGTATPEKERVRTPEKVEVRTSEKVGVLYIDDTNKDEQTKINNKRHISSSLFTDDPHRNATVFQGLYNECGTMARSLKLKGLEMYIDNIIRDYTEEEIRQTFENLKGSDFSWFSNTPDLDWLVRRDNGNNFKKILEGVYLKKPEVSTIKGTDVEMPVQADGSDPSRYMGPNPFERRDA